MKNITLERLRSLTLSIGVLGLITPIILGGCKAFESPPPRTQTLDTPVMRTGMHKPRDLREDDAMRELCSVYFNTTRQQP